MISTSLVTSLFHGILIIFKETPVHFMTLLVFNYPLTWAFATLVVHESINFTMMVVFITKLLTSKGKTKIISIF